MEQCVPGLECRDMVCEVPLVALNGACTMTNECEADLTCYDETCMNIAVSSAGQACTMDVECGNINGASVGECRNMMCGFIPAVLEGEMCT